MSKLEDLSVDDSAIKRIVHRHIESETAPEFNIQSRTFKLIPFDIITVKYRPSKELIDGSFSDPSIWIVYNMKIKSSWVPDKVEEISKSISITIDDYVSESRNQKIRSLGVTLSDKVREKINEYIGFNSDELFPINSLVRIFGGAVRDAISDREIHDVDIIVGSGSLDYVENILTKNGYKYMESLTPKDLSSIYNDIRVINEPHSWIKGDKIIQLIRPSVGMLEDGKEKEIIYKKSLLNLISNVDISCCGLSYSESDGLQENYKNAISHAQNGVFYVNKKAKMYSNNRINHRIDKLIKRGWIQLDDDSPSLNRDFKIQLLDI